ncbi:MAG: DUF2974 domain-containing protein [Oscillospiraceae bacterium]|nr:DUF2974 domain-containing protein [Oscillospiraceae bacterium]
MKLKRITAIILTLAMLFSILPLTGTVYATENEEKEVDVTTADYPIMIKDRINAARLTKIGQYSELTDEEKDAVCKYYHLEDSIFVACEKAGYNILDSVRIAKASIAAEVTPAEYKEYVNAYGSEEEASFQLHGYKTFKNKYGTKYRSEVSALMKEGYSQYDLRKAYYVAKKLDTEIASIIPDNKIKLRAADADTDIAKFSAMYFCDPVKLEEVTLSKNKSLSEVVNTKRISGLTAEKITEAELQSIESAEKPDSTRATTASSIDMDSKINSREHEFISAPSTYFVDGNEYVNASTGTFSYRENIIDMKGVNGLDLDLDLVFSPNSNLYFGEDQQFGIKRDWYNSSKQVYARAESSALGIGWSFNLPGISYTREWQGITEDAPGVGMYFDVYRYHMPDGGAYELERVGNSYTLVGYPKNDVVVSIGSGFRDDASLSYKATFADGRYEYYDEYGRIRIRGDKYGNEMFFDYYSSTSGDRDLRPEDADFEGELARITDTLGREINIGYMNDPYEDDTYDRIVHIYMPDWSDSIYLDLEANSASQPYYLEAIHHRPGTTEFTYTYDLVPCYDEPYEYLDTAGSNNIINIAQIVYNTGLTSRYSYEPVTVNNGRRGAKEIMRVSSRYETYENVDVYDIEDILRLTTYTYAGEYSGYSTRVGVTEEESELYMNPNTLPSDYEYIVTRTENGVQTKTTFNNFHSPKIIETKTVDEDYEVTGTVSTEQITYDEYHMPIKKQKQTGSHVTTVEQFENDSKGNVIKHWSKYSGNNKNNEYLATYAYSPAYNLLTSAVYKQNADKTITETYTLSTDGKSVTQKEVKENDTVRERTGYTYDSLGNVTKERKYKSDTEYIDVNYDYTDTAGADRDNAWEFDGAYLTKMWQSGGNDIDGTAIGNVQYTYEYDDFGRQIKTTDPTGKTTTYTYDAYDRITQIKNPDNTTQRFSYTLSKTANNTTVTDEAGTQTRYEYDSANNLLTVIDVTSGEELESYDYDRWHRPVKERNVQLIDSGHVISYTYDVFDRVTDKTTVNYDEDTVAQETYAYDDGATSAYLITTQTVVGDRWSPSVITKEYVNAYGDLEKTGFVTGTNEYFTTYKYDYLGNKTEELSALADQKDWTNTFTSKWEYDYAGRVTKEYDADSKYTLYEYDWLGRPVKFYDKNATALEEPYYTSYTYDALGNVIRETVPQTATTDKVTEFKYDKLGRVTEQRTLYDIVNNTEQYHTVTYTYDWRGNVLVAAQGGVTTTYTYDNLGRCLTSTTDGKTTTYTYDRFGNCLTETFAGKTDTYEYDMNGNRTKHTDRMGVRMLYEPDAMQRVYSMNPSSESGGRTFDYSISGQMYLALDATGMGRVEKQYDDRGNQKSESGIGNYKTYTHDIAGNRESLSFKTLSLTYTYNTLGQLTAVNNANVPVVSYTYDSNGNIATEAKSAVTQSYTYNRDGSIASIVTTNNIDNTSETTTYTYYLNGNLKTETLPDNTTKTYTYNNRDMLVTEALSTGKTTTYAYNNSGNRTSKTVTQNSQNTVTSYTYDAYGNEDNASATDTNPFRYSGEYYDAETGFIYLRARYYDPSIGRFTAEDPIRDGTNWYVYCNNNPVMYVDPWGLAPTKEEAAAMADHIYNWEKDSDKSDRTIAGWRLIDVWRGRESMKMGFYINDNDDWRNPSEYAIVFRGSIVEMNLETIDVWKNNAEQFFSAKSADMWDAINYSTGFASSHSQEITFVGHSKGGAEALAAAVATGRNAMVFNPAKPNLSDYNLSTNNYTGNAMSYVVRNEALNNLFGEPGIGKVKYLDQQYKTPWYLIGRVRKVADVVNSIRNHMMDAVLSGI